RRRRGPTERGGGHAPALRRERCPCAVRAQRPVRGRIGRVRRFAAARAAEVRSDAEGGPTLLRWRGRLEPVRVCNTWRSGGAWWRGEEPRAYFRVLTRSGALLVLFR